MGGYAVSLFRPQTNTQICFLWIADYNCWEEKRSEKSQFEFHKHHPDLVTVLNSIPLGGERTILHSQHETRIRYAKKWQLPGTGFEPAKPTRATDNSSLLSSERL